MAERRSKKDAQEKPRPNASSGGKKRGAKRRSLLKAVGWTTAGVLGVGIAGITARAVQTGAAGDLTQGSGFAPWRQWQDRVGTSVGADGAAARDLPGAPEPTPTDALQAAILAASPHNTQPWTFSVNGNVIDLLIDESRWMQTLDPFQRELLIGLGCCLENMVIGARAVGYSPLVNMFPDGYGAKCIARVTLYRAAKEVTPLAIALGRRHTHRGAYRRDRPVDLKTISQVEKALESENTRLFWFDAEQDGGQSFATATLVATQAFVEDAELCAASDTWLRHDLTTTNRRADGLPTISAGLSPLMTRGALMLPQQWTGDPHQTWLKQTRDVQLPSTPMFGMILVPAVDDRLGLVEAGRLWQRMHLHGTATGLAMQPLNQLMEMADRQRTTDAKNGAIETMAKLINFDRYTPVFGFRVGYSDQPPFPSPRRNVALTMGNIG